MTVRKSHLIKLSLRFYSKHPPPFFFLLSPQLNICLSIHGWICIPLSWVPGGRGGGWWNGYKVRIQAHWFPSHWLVKDNTGKLAHFVLCYWSPNITNIFIIRLMSQFKMNIFRNHYTFFITAFVHTSTGCCHHWFLFYVILNISKHQQRSCALL